MQTILESTFVESKDILDVWVDFIAGELNVLKVRKVRKQERVTNVFKRNQGQVWKLRIFVQRGDIFKMWGRSWNIFRRRNICACSRWLEPAAVAATYSFSALQPLFLTGSLAQGQFSPGHLVRDAGRRRRKRESEL